MQVRHDALWSAAPCGASVKEAAIMFGLGRNKRQVRNETFSPHRLRNAAVAGLGMLAWKWWRNRQETSRPGTAQDRSFTEGSSAGGRF
jgi:hypothetical protein